MNKQGFTWSEEEIEFLKKNYGKMSVRQIAKILGRTTHAIKSKAYKMGFTNKEQAYCKCPKYLKPILEEINKYWHRNR